MTDHFLIDVSSTVARSLLLTINMLLLVSFHIHMFEFVQFSQDATWVKLNLTTDCSHGQCIPCTLLYSNAVTIMQATTVTFDIHRHTHTTVKVRTR